MVYSAQRIKLRIVNNDAGRFLVIEGINDNADVDAGESPHGFCFKTEQEINDFAAICKKMLKNAEVLEFKQGQSE